MSDERRCPGCGAIFQTTDPTKKGYVREDILLRDKECLCERCFSLVHYHRDLPLPFEAERYQEIIAKIAASGALVVAVCDLFDLEGTFLADLNHLFPDSPIILVANKADLFPRDIKRSKMLYYLDSYRASHGVKVGKSCVISANDHEDGALLLELIEEERKKSHSPDAVYFIGRTNVGKSSLIKTLSYVAHAPAALLTVSDLVSTTQDLVKVSLPNGYALYDTPGLLNPSAASYYLSKASLEAVVPKKTLRPAVLQWFGTSTLFIGGFARVTIEAHGDASVVAYFARPVVLHRTKEAHALAFYEAHKDDLLRIPTPMERQKLGSMDTIHVFHTSRAQKRDITFSGLGFITILGDTTVKVVSFAPLAVASRPALV